MVDNQINNIISIYSRIKRFPEKYKDILKIDKPMRWLLADDKEQYVSIYTKSKQDKIINIDISSCFPSICKYLFKKDKPEFIKKIYDLTDKKERNILISNTLKNTGYLRILNIISKMLIFGYTFDRRDSEEILLLEFEKDGNLVSANSDYVYQIKNVVDSDFLKFIDNNQFKFHTEEYEYYIRCNRTSFFWKDGKLRLKGMYKHIPKGLEDIINNIFSGSQVDLSHIKKIYSQQYLNIIQKNNLNEILQNYYFDSENRVLNGQINYEKYDYYKTLINPNAYLQTWIYPVLLFQKQVFGNMF